MKRIYYLILTIIPLSAFADIIVKKDSKTIEDVTIVSVSADNVVYKQGSSTKTISSSEVDGVLYDDGRYITPPHQQTTPAEPTIVSDDSWSTSEKVSNETDVHSCRVSRVRLHFCITRSFTLFELLTFKNFIIHFVL